MINELKMTKLNLTKRAVVDLYEYCAKNMNEKGYNSFFSMAIVLNEMTLGGIYNEIVSKLYLEQNDPEYMEYAQKHNELLLKYADRDTNGQIIYEQVPQGMPQQPQIKEMIVEFNEEEGKLQETYKDAIARSLSKPEVNGKVLAEPIECQVICVDLDKLPQSLEPRMVGLFAGNVIKEALT